ncbi:MAG: hypothetical protein ACRD80_04000, partial [Nitrososphaeraceae archaeon]
NKVNQELSKLEKHVEELKIPKAKKPRDVPLNVPLEDLITWDILFKLAMINKFPTEDNEFHYRKSIRLLVALALKKLRSMKG